MIYYIYSFLIAFIISYFLTPLFISIAKRYQIVDHPDTYVKTHKVATPYLGGFAIWFGFTISLLIIRYITNFPTGILRSLRGILIGTTLL